MIKKRPNIILIMTDQQRIDTINALGYDYMITPNMDSLIDKGTAYTKAFCPGATCVASRAAMFTGLYSHNSGVYSFDDWSHHRSWVEDLSENSYHCVNIGKMHVKPIFDNIGFHERKVIENKAENYEAQNLHEDEWGWWLTMHGEKRDTALHKTDPDWKQKHNCMVWEKGENLHSDVYTGNLAKEWINNWNQSKPLFMQIGFPGPHDPFDPPERYLKMYDGIEFPQREFVDGELEDKPPQQKAHQTYFRTSNNDQSQINTRDAKDEDIQKIRKHYSANITLIDDKIGEIINALKVKGMLDNTVIILTSDHGDNLGDHKLPYKWLMYDNVTNVPLIIKDFRKPNEPSIINSDLVSLMDLGPTILGYGGIKIPNRLEGINLNSDSQNKYVFCEDNYLIMIRDKDYKLVYYIDQTYGELYDLNKDHKEFNNLFDNSEYSKIKNRMILDLLAWFSKSCYFNKTYKSRAADDTKVRWPGAADFENYLHGKAEYVQEE
ncbi:MAG: sulfatase-like hydrolase/transferase [Spirochaetaceae bacterium]